jgi:hypothetical protein
VWPVTPIKGREIIAKNNKKNAEENRGLVLDTITRNSTCTSTSTMSGVCVSVYVGWGEGCVGMCAGGNIG